MERSEVTPEAIEFAGFKRVNYTKLPWEEKLTIMWGWYWRAILVGLAVGGVSWLGALFFGMVLFAFAGNMNPAALFVLFLMIFLPIGIITYHPLIRWILNSRIGGYRVLLCKYRDDDRVTIEPPEPRPIVSL